MTNIVFTGRGVNGAGVFTARRSWTTEAVLADFNVMDRISLGVDFLVASRSDTRKAHEARNMGIQVITYQEFIGLMDASHRRNRTRNAIEDARGEAIDEVGVLRPVSEGRALRPGNPAVEHADVAAEAQDARDRAMGRVAGTGLPRGTRTGRRTRAEIQAAGRAMRPAGSETGRWSSGNPPDPHVIPRGSRVEISPAPGSITPAPGAMADAIMRPRSGAESSLAHHTTTCAIHNTDPALPMACDCHLARHASSCAVYNNPAMAAGPCDCHLSEIHLDTNIPAVAEAFGDIAQRLAAAVEMGLVDPTNLSWDQLHGTTPAGDEADPPIAWVKLNGQDVKFCRSRAIVFRVDGQPRKWVMVRLDGTELTFPDYKGAVDEVAAETSLDAEAVKVLWPWDELVSSGNYPTPEPENFTATAPAKARCWDI